MKHDETFRRNEVKRVQKYKKDRVTKRTHKENKTSDADTIKSTPKISHFHTQKPQLVVDVVFLQDRLCRQQLIMTGFIAQTLDEIMPEVVGSFLEECWRRGRDLYRSYPAPLF